MTDYNETPVQFGPDGSLIGIVTTPGDGKCAPVACLMFNMGAIHRIGPRRSNVKLARQLAARGISSIRIDLAGLGDSRPATGTEHFRTQARLDLQAAMNLVGTMLGVHRFIVIGLCSGAFNGLVLSVADPRVVGLLMFDGYAFPGRRARFERSARRALADATLGSLLGLAMRLAKRTLLRKPATAASAAGSGIFVTEAVEDSPEYFCRSMNQLAERNVALLLIYTGTVHVKDRKLDQLGPFTQEAFARKVEYRFFREIDHGLIMQTSQQTFMNEVCDWALRIIHRDGRQSSPANSSSIASAAATRQVPSAAMPALENTAA